VRDDRSAALLLRVWLEEETGEIRARLSAVGGTGPDEPGEDRTVALASSPGDVLDAVSHWLDGFIRNGTEHD
jgi:hypothetical protein